MVPTRLVSFFFASGLFRLWQLVPRQIRKRLVKSLLPLPRFPSAPEAVQPLYVCGLLGSVVGLGWSARNLVRLAQEARIEVQSIDVSHGFQARDLPGVSGPELSDPLGSGTIILNCNPNQLSYVSNLLPRGLFKSKYRIAHCTWELERVPDDWIEALDFINEVWVPSRFVHNAFLASGCTKPVRIVPYNLKAPNSRPERSRFGLPNNRFLVVCSFSINSGMARKNPTASIQAFRRAFPAGEPATLVIKLSAGRLNQSQTARMRSASQGDPRIVFYERSLSDTEMYDFLSCFDAVLSLHRSEGFGLVLAQGMLLGKPVIATGWSGNTDFMAARNSELVPYRLVPVRDPDGIYLAPSLSWADPDVDAAAVALRRCFQSKSHCARLGAEARSDVTRFFERGAAETLSIFKAWPQALPRQESDSQSALCPPPNRTELQASRQGTED